MKALPAALGSLLPLVATVAVLAGAAGAGLAAPPVLGRPWASGQTGYGRPAPVEVDNGGDPTGIVRNIHWAGWGAAKAVGTGRAEYEWPGTSVADNGFTGGARIVAFHLGTCRGVPSYNAVEWYFPKYGETFNPSQYINTCTGRYYGALPKETACPDVPLTSGGVATEVKTVHVSCAVASTLVSKVMAIARIGGGYMTSGGRYTTSGFRCGTMGAIGLGSALFDCSNGRQEFYFSVAS